MRNHTSRFDTKYIFSLTILIGFLVYFTYDIFTLKKTFTHPDFITCYYSFRQWFSQRLLNGEFPIWNPYWGLGITADIWATIPIDIYTIFEIIFGPQYHYFQVIQFGLILAVGFYVFVKLEFKPLVSTAGIMLYVMMPWVTFYYFYFMIPHSYVGNMLLFLFTYLWFKTENYKYLFFITWTVILSMFGTKPEYWFVQTIYFVFLSSLAASLFYTHKLLHSIRVFSLAILSVITGILAHLWQLNILSRIIKFTGRSFNHSFLNLFSCEMYRNFFLSIAESSLLKMLGAGLLLYLGVITKKIFPKILFLSLGFIAFFWLKIWKFTEITSFMNIKNPIFIGTMIGTGFSFLAHTSIFPSKLISFIKDYRNIVRFLCDQTKTALLFLLFIYYWFNEGSYETMKNLVHSAPFVFKILLATLVWLGCTQFWKNKLVKLAYFSILFVFLMREHGQILLTYLTGLVWMPARDTYMVDFAVAVLAVMGLSVLDISVILGPQRKWYNRISAVSLIAIGIIVFSASSNFYYSHWFMEKSPPDYPYYTGIPKIRKVVHELRDSPTTRIYFLRNDPLSHTYGFGDALLEGVSQVTLYASSIPKNYRDWAIYRELGIRPEEEWGGYPPGYTQKIISKLPQKNTLGYRSIPSIYYFTVLTRPPVEKNTLKILGVKYIIRIFPKSEWEAYTLDPKAWVPIDAQPVKTFIDKLIKELDLKDTKLTKINEFIYYNAEGLLFTARLNNPLPRAFLVDGVSNANINEFMNEMDPVITDKNDIIKTKSFEFLVKDSARIE
ncbi:MAG: hypothetical protein Q8O30_06220, partial [Candidatus Omnitrophota bacterium]|nr:hypothetical protein [Candidatus Omnitrophota bacterium]